MSNDKDALTKKFMEDTEVFADAFNFLLYDGQKVIKPENLTALDTTAIAAPYGTDSADAPVQKFRDVLKGWIAMKDDSAAYLLLGVENQSEIHYAMPVRNMVYDALQYSAQVEEAARSYRKSKAGAGDVPKPTAGEFLSGFHRSDRLIPVITLVVYFGANEWDAPMSLHEMMSVRDEKLLRFAADYRINLVSPAALTSEDADKFSSDLREVMLFVKYSRDKKALTNLLASDEKFRSIERMTAEVINAVTGSKLKINRNEEVVDMCKAIEDIRAEERAEGLEQGLEEGREQGLRAMISVLRSMDLSDEQIIEKIISAFNLTHDKAMQYMSADE